MRLWCSVDIFFLSLSFKTDTFFIILSFEEIRSSSCPYDARHVSTCFNLSPPPPPPSSYFSQRIRDSIIEIMTRCVIVYRYSCDWYFHFCFIFLLICCVIRSLSVHNTYVFSSIFIYIYYYYHSYTIIQLNRIIIINNFSKAKLFILFFTHLF